jgi:pimeloyl-ACP methyl ester carboxylesterase
VFFPGNDRTQLERGQRVLEYLRNERDFGLLVVAYRGYDSSSGVASPDAFAADGTRILDVLLKTEQVAPSRVHVVAFSLGGFVACSAVSAAAKAGQRVASLTLLASIGAAEMHTSLLAARLTIGDVYDVRPLLDGVPGPVLVVQGTADEALSLETSRDITRRLGARATFVELPGAPHEITDVNAALDHTRAMIERNVER